MEQKTSVITSSKEIAASEVPGNPPPISSSLKSNPN